MKSQINTLQLVYPPMTNQEAEWLKNDGDVQSAISQSNLYMICHRAEAFFRFPDETSWESNTSGEIPFSIECGGKTDHGLFSTHNMITDRNIDLDTNDIEIEIGEKLFRFWEVSKATGGRIRLIDWFTTDKAIFDKWRGYNVIKGLENYRQFTNYSLHYVGISKKDDSLTRLVIQPHDKRIRVLSNENPINQGSRVTDELILLFFTVNPLRITTIENENDLNDMLSTDNIDKIPIIADAEKAYVKVLESQYNQIKYKSYPKGSDGLYGTGHARYGFVIGEDITLSTKKDEIRGGHITEYYWPNDIDFIFIEGDKVTLEKHDSNIV